MEIDRNLRYQAISYLQDIPNIRQALLLVEKDPDAFRVRVTEFQKVLEIMNSMLLEHYIDPDSYGKLGELRRDLPKGALFPSLTEPHSLFIRKTLSGVKEKVVSGEWPFAIQVDDPNKLASGLLIEGYGLFLEKFYQLPGVARKFVVAFEEVLFNIPGPKLEMLDDVVEWIREEAGDLSPKTRDRLRRYVEVTSFLNQQFRQRIPASQVLDAIQKLPRPIVVDFIDVLASNGGSLEMNPEAPDFLPALSGLGNVFIVTAESSWEGVAEFLAKNNLWSEGIVLMTLPNYSTPDNPNPDKRLSKVFAKPWQVPIIDYSPEVTEDNPGMLGILVKGWDPKPGDWSAWQNQDPRRLSLKEAVERVSRHFSELGLIPSRS